MALYHLAHYTARSEQCSINEYIMATEQARAGVSDIPQVRSAKRQPDPGLHGPAAFCGMAVALSRLSYTP